jgi:hypothetical protein
MTDRRRKVLLRIKLPTGAVLVIRKLACPCCNRRWSRVSVPTMRAPRGLSTDGPGDSSEASVPASGKLSNS